MLQKNTPITIADFNKGLFTFSNYLQNEKGHSPNTMNVKWNFDGSIQKRLGSTTQNTTAIGANATTSWIIETDSAITTSLQAYWKLDEPSGVRYDQFSTNSLNTINNPQSLTGIRGGAAHFIASQSQSLIIQTTGPLQTGNISFSINAWFYLDTTSSTKEYTIVSKRDPIIDSATLLLLHGSGAQGSQTFIDSSIYNRTLTAFGSVKIDSGQSVFGNTSILWTTTADYIGVPYSAEFALGVSDFTIQARVRFTSIQSGKTIVSHANTSNFATYWSFLYSSIDSGLELVVNSNSVLTLNPFATWKPNTGTFYEVAIQRRSNTFQLFVDGIQIGNNYVSTAIIPDVSDILRIGMFNPSNPNPAVMIGHQDELRISNVARYTGNYSLPTVEFGPTDLEYWLFVNTDNVATFGVSSNGTAFSPFVRATSFGTLAAGSFYNVVAWHNSGAAPHLGISVNRSATTASYTGAVRIGSAPFMIGGMSDSITGAASYHMDGRIDEVGFWKKTLTANERQDMYSGGSGNTFTKNPGGFTWACYDFGASSVRWVVFAAGSGIQASSNLGVTFVSIATSRTQTYQYFERSKNVIIACSDAYDQTLYWAGSAGTFAIALAVNSAPKAKFAQNHQGFLILLNSTDSNGTINKRRFHYVDESLQLTSAYPDFFDLPSTADDEITASVILNRTLYVSTKYRIYRVSYVGGNPDWSYQVVAYWGYVPRTVQRASLQGGEVAIGMDWAKRIRVFDGTKDFIISDNIEDDNGLCDFATDKISYAGSGLIVGHAVIDPNEQEYRLNVAIGTNSQQTTHCIILNLRSLALYPYSNQGFNCMCTADSAGRTFLMAGDRSGRVYVLNTGNLDIATAIDEVYESPFIFNKVPGAVQKSNKIDMYFKKDSSGTIYFQDRADFSSEWENTKTIDIINSESNLFQVRSFDIPSTHNVYQFKIMSSSSTANPWQLAHLDYFLQTMGIGKGQ